MHDRKIEMAKRAGGFVGLPGGSGTYEEVFRTIARKYQQLKALPNVSGTRDLLDTNRSSRKARSSPQRLEFLRPSPFFDTIRHQGIIYSAP